MEHMTSFGIFCDDRPYKVIIETDEEGVTLTLPPLTLSLEVAEHLAVSILEHIGSFKRAEELDL